MRKPRYRYWESTTHPRYRKGWTLVGGIFEYEKRARAGRGVPIMIIIERSEHAAVCASLKS